MSTSIIDIFKSYKNKADGDYNSVATEYANLDIEWLVKNGNQTISANTSWGNTTNDARNLLVLVKGNLTINSGCTLTAAARKRGMFIYVNGNCTINGTISMTARGAYAAGQRLLICNIGSDYEVPAVGGTGGAGISTGLQGTGVYGNEGISGVATGACGGGGGGAVFGYSYHSVNSGAGGTGTSYSGGAAGGGAAARNGAATATAGSSTGGAGGAAGCNASSISAGGGAGNPGGAGLGTGGETGNAGTGGLLVVYVRRTLTVGASGSLNAVGATGGGGTAGGGGSGGGHVDIFYKNLSGTINYDVSGAVGGGWQVGGAGGAGSSRATQVALPNLFPSGGAFLLNMV